MRLDERELDEAERRMAAALRGLRARPASAG